jgi:hypothetical protein
MALDVGSIGDDAIVQAIGEAVRQWEEYRAERGYSRHRKEQAMAYDVAYVLAGANSIEGRRPMKVARGDVIRVGQRLGKLARAGRIKIVSPPSASRCYAVGHLA